MSYEVLDATIFGEQRASRVRYIRGGNQRSTYMLTIDLWNNVEARIAPRPATEEGTFLPGRRCGYLSIFGGTPEYTGSNVDGGVIFKVYVSSQHRRKGLATAMLDFARDEFPEKDVRHSDALTDDGAAWAAATPTPNDLRSSAIVG